MGRRREVIVHDKNQTSIALFVACIGGGGISFFVDSTLDALLSTGDQHSQGLTNWRVHMSSTCLGTIAFFIILFCLELVGRRSKMMAWRSSWPWLPLIGLTALASLIHIPAYAVILIGAIFCVWAYRQARGVL